MPEHKKIILDYEELAKRVLAHQTLGHHIVCTIGSWDMLHIGHLRYLKRAKASGDILVVGVDGDEGIKKYKNPLRPIIPEHERMEMLSYQDCVDYVTLIHDIDEQGRWQYGLLDLIPFDSFVIEDRSYSPEQKDEIKNRVRNIVTLDRQAEKTSSTDIIQNILKTHLLEMVNQMRK